jgi:hypothetical protein
LKLIIKMSSLLDPEASFTCSTTAESIETSQSHAKKWRAPVWAFCRRPMLDENQDFLLLRYECN